MALFAGERRHVAEAVASLCYQNPYAPGREALERRALGVAYRDGEPGAGGWAGPNSEAIAALAGQLVDEGRDALAAAEARRPEDVALYQGIVRFHLRGRLSELFEALSQAAEAGGLTRRRVSSYPLFEQEAQRLLQLPGGSLPLMDELPHLFATLFQVRRASRLIEGALVGQARAVCDLRAAVWTSLFTHDACRYERGLFSHLDHLPTLLVGPAGTAKPQVAYVLAMGRYIPFEAEELRFTHEPAASYRTLDVAAVAEPRLEAHLSDLARVGSGGTEGAAAPGARADRPVLCLSGVDALGRAVQGRRLQLLSPCPHGTVGPTGQAGGGVGKLIATTTRDLLVEMREGRFCEGLYHELGADVIELPSLALQLRQRPQDLGPHVVQLLGELLPGGEQARAVGEVQELVERELGPRYPWPGNLLELRRCVRSIVLRGTYRPARPAAQVASGVVGTLSRRFENGDFNADGLLDAYCTLMYRQTGSYQEAARRLGLDRRTVKSRVDATLLAELS